jgi:hypothetical protein
VPGFSAVPASADVNELPNGHREFEVLNDRDQSVTYQIDEDGSAFTTFCFQEPGVYYCRLFYGCGHSIGIESDTFVVFVDTEDTAFNRLFTLAGDYGRGVPSTLYCGDGAGTFTLVLSLNNGSGVDGFWVNNINSSDDGVAGVGWSETAKARTSGSTSISTPTAPAG